MNDLQTRLESFEQLFQGQRDKIPDSLRRQTKSVEQACTNIAAALSEIQSGFDGVVTSLESKLTEPVSYICDTVHALDDRTGDFSAWQQWVNQQLVTANARLESRRSMIQEQQQPREQELCPQEPPATQDSETQVDQAQAMPDDSQTSASQTALDQGPTTSRRRCK